MIVILNTGADGYVWALRSGWLEKLLNEYDLLEIITQILMSTTAANLV